MASTDWSLDSTDSPIIAGCDKFIPVSSSPYPHPITIHYTTSHWGCWLSFKFYIDNANENKLQTY